MHSVCAQDCPMLLAFYTFLSDVFKLLTLTIAVNIWKDQVFYMLKPVLFCIADINQTFVNWRTEEKMGLGEGEEASAPVVAGVKDLMVCMKDTGMYLKLTLPNTILRQKIKDIGRMRLQRSAGLTSISGFNCSTLIAMWAPIVEQIKCTVDTVKGNLKSNFCMHPSIHTHILWFQKQTFSQPPPPLLTPIKVGLKTDESLQKSRIILFQTLHMHCSFAQPSSLPPSTFWNWVIMILGQNFSLASSLENQT